MYSIMDSNENENYNYKGAIPKTTVKYQNQFNNNLNEQENLMPQQNGTTTNGSVSVRNCGVPANIECSSLGNNAQDSAVVDSKILKKSENICHINGKNDDSAVLEIGPGDESNLAEDIEIDDDFSDANSIGNLSYISENGLIEEIILLPNNIYSDDENASASDDCVYAYRGGDQAIPLLEEAREQQDDETDFLEMDFDPEPSSELENFIENNEMNVDAFSPRSLNQEVPVNNVLNKIEQQEKQEIICMADMNLQPSTSSLAVRKTGTIPKTLSMYQQAETSFKSNKINQKNLTLDLNKSNEMDNNYKYCFPRYNPPALNDDEENSCLDCTEKEFLMQTKQDLSMQKVCKTCHTRNKSTSEYFIESSSSSNHPMNSSCSETDLMNMRAEQIVLQALNKVNELKATPPSIGLSRSVEEFCARAVETMEEQPLSLISEDIGENMVTIYTINCDEETIIEALTRIGIAPNVEVLKQFLSVQNSVDTVSMSIPQYLLHMSKRDCNYNKLIEAIKLCCDEPLDIHYYPLDPFSDIPEIVQINSVEIAKRWFSNTNLRQIINFRHKHFHTLNVLGKVVNILRQPSRGRNTNQLINIPQYYNSGYITITRIT